MKFFLSVILLLVFSGTINAQINNPVFWTYSAKKIGVKTYELHITAIIQDKWHIYAQDAGEGSVPTKIVFSPNPLITLEGKVKEVGTLEKNFDQNFNSTLKYYEKQVDFVQVVKLRSSISTVEKGTLTFMVCNDHICLPPRDIPFSIKIDGK